MCSSRITDFRRLSATDESPHRRRAESRFKQAKFRNSSPRIFEVILRFSPYKRRRFAGMRGLIPSATVLRSLRSRTLPPPSNPLNRLTRSPAASSFFTTFRLPARSPVVSRGAQGVARGSGRVKLGGNALLGGGISHGGGRTAQGTPARWIRSFHSSRAARDVFFVSTSSFRRFVSLR